MDHITVITVSEKIVKLIPDAGYRLLDERDNRQYSEAVIKTTDARFFKAVAING